MEGDEDTVVAVCAVLPSRSAGLAAVLARLVTDAERPRAVWSAAARSAFAALSGHRAAPITEDTFRTLARRARTAEDSVARADALRRLHACADALQPYQAARTAPEEGDALIRILEETGLYADAARLAWEAALDSVRNGRHDEARWHRLLRLCETAPGRLPSTTYLPVNFRHARVRDAALGAARFLRARDSTVAGRLALHLVDGAGRAADWDACWRAELDALRAHPDPDTATEALLLDSGERE